MKRILTMAAVMTMALNALAQPYVWHSTNTVNAVIPDNNPSGLAGTMAVSGLAAPIQNVSVTLDITGGFNGDLYAYLAGPNGGFAVLLNRPGVSGTSTFGYNDTGFKITLDDSVSATGIHFYQTGSPVYSGGQLTGTWGSDGENINPQSSPSAFNSGSGSATLATFNNLDGNGTWTLFLADLSAVDQSTLVSWSLDITTVPEPSTLALGALGIALIASRNIIRRK
jgi:subtilisin-like proprotein convertase family protein